MRTHPLLGDAAQPVGPLLLRRPYEDGVAAQGRREDQRRDSDIDAGQALAHTVRVERAATQPAVLLGDEDELHAELVTTHRSNGVLGAHVLVVELKAAVGGQSGIDELAQRTEHQGKRLWVESNPARVSGGRDQRRRIGRHRVASSGPGCTGSTADKTSETGRLRTGYATTPSMGGLDGHRLTE